MSPVVLAFILGGMAVFLKSDLKFSDNVYQVLSIYLLMALGLKGGAALSQIPLATMVCPILLTLSFSALLPFISFSFARLMRLARVDAAALAAHYGSVSVVTFMASQVFIQSQHLSVDGYMPALVAILEIPGLVIALLLSGQMRGNDVHLRDLRKQPVGLWGRLRGVLVSKSILMILGGLFIGFLSGEKGLEQIRPFFIDPFYGVLVLFMLDMGIFTATKFLDLKYVPRKILGYALAMPIFLGSLGGVAAMQMSLGVGSSTVFAAMCASASYIAAPAACRAFLPSANPAFYLTASLVVTFPFNLTFGIPLYYAICCFISEKGLFFS